MSACRRGAPGRLGPGVLPAALRVHPPRWPERSFPDTGSSWMQGPEHLRARTAALDDRDLAGASAWRSPVRANHAHSQGDIKSFIPPRPSGDQCPAGRKHLRTISWEEKEMESVLSTPIFPGPVGASGGVTCGSITPPGLLLPLHTRRVTGCRLRSWVAAGHAGFAHMCVPSSAFQDLTRVTQDWSAAATAGNDDICVLSSRPALACPCCSCSLHEAPEGHRAGGRGGTQMAKPLTSFRAQDGTPQASPKAVASPEARVG